MGGFVFVFLWFLLVESKYLWGHGQYRCLGSVCISVVSLSAGRGAREEEAAEPQLGELGVAFSC